MNAFTGCYTHVSLCQKDANTEDRKALFVIANIETLLVRHYLLQSSKLEYQYTTRGTAC